MVEVLNISISLPCDTLCGTMGNLDPGLTAIEKNDGKSALTVRISFRMNELQGEEGSLLPISRVQEVFNASLALNIIDP